MGVMGCVVPALSSDPAQLFTRLTTNMGRFAISPVQVSGTAS